jgi:hypothetical protein
MDVESFQNALAKKTTDEAESMLNDDEPSILDLDFEHIGWHERRTPAELFSLGQKIAKLSKAEYLAKRKIRREEAASFHRAYSRGVVELGKTPTQVWCENQVDLDEPVIKAHALYAEILEQKKAAEALYTALERKAAFIPAMQGRTNALKRQD